MNAILDPSSPAAVAPKVGMISLGCAKNLVDAELMLGSILANGMEITSDADDADVLIVNTCSFIDSAKEESIEAILEAHEARGMKRRPGQKLIVSGCMAQRFSKELSGEMPEVDAFMGLDQVAQAGDIVAQVLARPRIAVESHPTLTDESWQPLNLVTRKPVYIPDYDTPRFRLTPSHSAYVKIAEGCNHPCSFCVIPQMRGKHRSRSIHSVVTEIKNLVAEGVREFNLISQDTTYYGMDLWDQKAGPTQLVDSSRGVSLVHLLMAIDQIEGDFWVRLLYTHPAHFSDELIGAIARSKHVARYIDMPLQHIHPEMLLTMRREATSQHIIDLLARIRAGIPGIAIRTTFIVGFPGETEEHFEALLQFIRDTRFERLGIFTYSQEEGSRAAKMDNQIPLKVRQARYRKAMKLQQRIAGEIAAANIGRTIRAIVDSPLVARSEADAPDVDARILLTAPATVGAMVEVKITGTQVYDLVGEVI